MVVLSMMTLRMIAALSLGQGAKQPVGQHPSCPKQPAARQPLATPFRRRHSPGVVHPQEGIGQALSSEPRLRDAAESDMARRLQPNSTGSTGRVGAGSTWRARRPRCQEGVSGRWRRACGWWRTRRMSSSSGTQGRSSRGRISASERIPKTLAAIPFRCQGRSPCNSACSAHSAAAQLQAALEETSRGRGRGTSGDGSSRPLPLGEPEAELR